MDWSGGSVVQFVNSWFVLLGLSAADARLGGDCIGKKARPTGLFEKKKKLKVRKLPKSRSMEDEFGCYGEGSNNSKTRGMIG